MDKQRLIRKFDRQSTIYDRRRENNAFDRVWRQNLLRHASGNVLELAVGAGGNFPFYPPEVTSATAVDFSPKMLDKAKRAADKYGIHANFICSDIETITFEDHAFDTVLSTLSLCGYENPLRILQKMNRWCKPGGTILLLEHGISHAALISWIQKSLDPLFHRLIGCHQNRNIPKLIQDSGIQIIRHESHIFNMIHVIHARTSADPLLSDGVLQF